MFKEFLIYYLLFDFVLSFMTLSLAIYVLKKRENYIKNSILSWLGVEKASAEAKVKNENSRSSCRDSW